MQQECSKSKTLALVRLLKRIGEGEDPRRVAREVGKIAGKVGPGEMEAAADRLRQSGYADDLVVQLRVAFALAGAYEQRRSRTSGQTPVPCILQIMSAEHMMFRSLAAELERVLEDIRALEHLSDTSVEFRRLAHAVHHLQAINEHFDREDDVILPYLLRRGWAGLWRAAITEHVQLRIYVDKLAMLVAGVGEFQPEEFRALLTPAITGFCHCLSEHLSFEDGLLWPCALVVLNDPAMWKTIAALCDEIGYCGIHT